MKTAVVTGATGFIGSAFVKYLLKNNYFVYAVVRNPEKLKISGDNLKIIVADFDKYGKLGEMIENAEYFYHFAWNGVFGNSFKDYSLQLDNVKYSCLALEQAKKMGVKRFIFAGTMNEYEMNSYINKNYFEPRYTYIYSVAKQTTEAICKTLSFNLGIEFLCGRIAMAYGENNKSEMIPNVVIKNILNNKDTKLIEGKNLYDMIYIDDIIRAFEAIGLKGNNMTSYYIGHRNIKTFREIICDIANILDAKCELLFGEYPDVPSGVDYNNIDLDLLYNDTGFECKADFKESILKTANWLKKQE